MIGRYFGGLRGNGASPEEARSDVSLVVSAVLFVTFSFGGCAAIELQAAGPLR